MTIATASVRRNDSARQFRLTSTEITCDASYVTGGYAVTAAQLGLSVVQHAWTNIKTAATTSTTDAWFDVANMKLKVNGPTAEVSNAASLASVVVTVYALGY